MEQKKALNQSTADNLATELMPEELRSILSRIAESENSLVVVTDANRRTLWANAAFLKKTGFQIEEVLGKNPGELLQGAQADLALKQRMSAALDAGEAFQCEILNFSKENIPYWIDMDIQPVHNRNGILTHFVAIQYDISERKELEFALRKKEEALRRSKNLLNDIEKITKTGGWEYTVETGEMFWTDELYRIHEMEVDPTIDHINGSIACYHPEDHETIRNAFEQCLKDGIGYDLEFPFRTVKGNQRWIRTKTEPVIENGTVVKVIGSFTDITEQYHTKQKLQSANNQLEASEKKYRAIFDKGLAAIIIADDNGTYTAANEAACRLFGYSMDELIGMNVSDLITGESSQNEKRYRDYLEKGEETGEFSFITGDGKQRTAYYLAIRVRENFNLSMLIDLTGQIEAKEKAEVASRAKSDFLAVMSHELRTPLSGVIGFTELLQNTDLTPLQRRYLDHANRSGHNLLRIINDILDFSKIEAGVLELFPEETDLTALIRDSLEIVRATAMEKKLTLSLHTGSGLPGSVYVDPVRLTQILTNLLGNAVKFTEFGEVALRAECRSVEEGRCTIFFEVRDTGIGISDEQKKRLFKAFSQADSSTTRQYGGTGLGLVISQMIAQKMGSRIDFESRPGKGSRFYFELSTEMEASLQPAVQEKSSSAVESPLKPDAESASVPSILIAEDVSLNMHLISALLGTIIPEAELFKATNGVEAVTLWQEKKPGLILMDLQMPEMGGLDATRKIRELEQKSGAEKPTTIIALTAAAMKEDRDECFEAGMDGVLTKPIDTGKLKEIVNARL